MDQDKIARFLGGDSLTIGNLTIFSVGHSAKNGPLILLSAISSSSSLQFWTNARTKKKLAVQQPDYLSVVRDFIRETGRHK